MPDVNRSRFNNAQHMFKYALRYILSAIVFFAATVVTAQKVHEPKFTKPEWTKPYPPFRIAGNLYYVGTYDLCCYLITTSKGNILINTGIASSFRQIKKSIESLGFKLSDTKILLTTQAHYDHVGAMAAIKKKTGAQFMVDEGDADVMATGGNADYEFGGKGSLFRPVKADRILRDKDTITLGDMQLVMLHHPGHTKGSCSFLLIVKDEQRSYKVLIANMPSIVAEKPFTEVAAYSNIATDYAYTFQAMKNLSFDLWMASHAGQCMLHKKHQPGDAYNPAAFADRSGYDEELNELQKNYDDKIKQDAAQK